ncbi:MAG: asparagine synthase (glutamine-hydrolyzing) [Nitrococcus sp.]|nr:asparagine synthase (glutamine-hydrolyzing) [Nitrococcus sp.]
MCGIAGIYQYDGQVSLERLRTATQRLTHRGPEDEGFWTDGPLGLGHTRLRIIDLEGGHQPLVTDDGALVLVANGEIYNHVELRAALEARGHRFATRSDCEVLLHAYREHGDDFLSEVCGMFAFALWDGRRRRLLLARDRLGIKPLFLRRLRNGLAFASELKALRPLGGRPEVDPTALVNYLAHQFCGGRRTLWADTERLLPGELVSIERGRVTQRRRYWDARHIETQETDFDTAAAEFDTLFDCVLRQHLRADVPIGLFLSGGVDSGVLAARLRPLHDEPLEGYSVGFGGAGFRDELPHAEATADRLGIPLHRVRPHAEELLRALPRSIWAADELMRDYANPPTLLLAQASAGRHKVVFSGEGGDEVFAGYRRFTPNPLERTLQWLLTPSNGGHRTSQAVARAQRRKLYADALLAAAPTAGAMFREAWQATPAAWSELQRRQYVELTTALPDNLLVKVDRMLMQHGVEGRVPFLDHRVVEFGLSLPDRLKVRDGHGKWFLKQWAARFLDRDALFAPKRGFHVPLRQGFGDSALQRLAGVLPSHPGIRAWFRPRGVRARLETDSRAGELSRIGFALLEFALWHQLFIDGDGGAPPAGVDAVALLEQA